MGAGANSQQFLAMPVVGAFFTGAVVILAPGKVVTGTLNGGNKGAPLKGMLRASDKVRVYFHGFCKLIVSIAVLVKSVPYFKGPSVKMNDLEQIPLLGRWGIRL
jgi:hypothetical protein